MDNYPSMQNHTYIPDGMLHNALYPEVLPKTTPKEVVTPTHLVVCPDTYNYDTCKTMKDNKYSCSGNEDRRCQIEI